MTRRNWMPMAMLQMMAAAGAQGKEELPNATLGSSQAKLIRAPFGDTRIYFDGPTDQLKSMTAGSLKLKAGQEPHPPHQHPEEEFVLVTEGSGEISIADAVTKVSAGSMMYCEGNKLHGIRNTGKTPLTFFFYKWQA